MAAGASSSTALMIIAAMVTPAMLILACASLVATALVRMARVVDRARVLGTAAHDGSWQKLGTTPAGLRKALLRHQARARCTEWSIAVLYVSVLFFVAACLAIVVDRGVDGSLDWLPVAFAMMGTLLLLVGGALMVIESRLGGEQVVEEIQEALASLDHQA